MPGKAAKKRKERPAFIERNESTENAIVQNESTAAETARLMQS